MILNIRKTSKISIITDIRTCSFKTVKIKEFNKKYILKSFKVQNKFFSELLLFV